MDGTDALGIGNIVATAQHAFLIALGAVIVIAGALVIHGVWATGRGAAEEWTARKR
ncbi:MAG: hypothetical protein QOJ13_874 [Gaiellales bacterium]|jgi:hypothetical protein|nr:hypothetical protein [Gaiellales bacterium]MDX6591678.1 hypothetical protein [Gaiellales bacterium]